MNQKENTFKNKKEPLPETQQRRAHNLGQKPVFPRRLGSNLQISMSRATDPIDLVNPFFFAH